MRFVHFTKSSWLTAALLVSGALLVMGLLSTHGWSDTPQARVKVGPWASGLKVGPRMNAAGMNLRGSEFVGQDLKGAVFERCDLCGVLFWDCDLSGASFKEAHLTDVFFQECRELEGTDFSDAVIAGLRIDSVAYLSPQQLMSTRSYKTKDLCGCTISGSVRGEPNAQPAYNFRKANLEGATLTYGDFRGCDFTDARIDRIKIYGCKMRFEQLASTKNFKDRRLLDMDITTQFDGYADFGGIDLTGTKLSIGGSGRASFADAIISECTLVGVLTKDELYATRNYQRGDLSGISFEYIDMSGWDLSRQNLTRCMFLGCRFGGASFEDAVITNAHIIHGLRLSTGLSLTQIKSTWNYKHGRMQGVKLPEELAAALESE